MYVDIDSKNKISIHDMTEDQALQLHQAIQNTFMNHPDADIRNGMVMLANELLINFKKACKNGES